MRAKWQEVHFCGIYLKEHKFNKYFRRSIKVVLWMFAGTLALLVLAVALLQVPGVQRYIARKVVASITEKTHTRIEVGSIDIAFTHFVALHDVFVEGPKRDTLLSFQTLAVDVNLFGLISHHINLTNIRIDSLTTHITRTLPDSNFNFQFILDALSPPSTAHNDRPDTSTGPSWELRFGGVHVNNLQGTYDDEVSGLNVRLHLGVLEASMEKFDIGRKHYRVDEITLANTTGSIVHTRDSPPDTSQSAATDLGLASLSLKNIHFNYQNLVDGERYTADVGSLNLLAEKIDLPSHRIAVKLVSLENTNVAVLQPKGSNANTEQSGSDASPWIISLDHLRFSNNDVRYDVLGAVMANGIDPNHLRLDGISMRADNLYYSENRLAADFGHTSFRANPHIELRELSGGFLLDSIHVRLRDFTIETGASRIRQDVLLNYSSIAELKSLAGTVKVKATISESSLAIADLLLFVPSLPIKNAPGAQIKFSSKLSGLIGDLQVEELQVAAGDSTEVNLSGAIRGFPSAKTAEYEIGLQRFASTRQDINRLVVDSLIPKSIALPVSMNVSGKFKGTMKNFSASAAVATSIGAVHANVKLSSGKGAGADVSRWTSDVSVEDFDLGSLLNNPETFGPVSMRASAVGSGLTMDDMKADVDVQVEEAVVKGYPYRGLSIRGTAGPRMFAGEAAIQDSNIALTFKGTINAGGENPTYKFTLDLKGADLRRLNLTPEDIRVAGIFSSDLRGQSINDLNGTIGARQVVIIKNEKRHVIDSLVYASVTKDGQSHLTIESSILEADYNGSIAPGDLPAMLRGYFAHYFAPKKDDKAIGFGTKAFTFRATLRDPAILTDVFFPDLHQLTAGTIEGAYSGSSMSMNVDLRVPRFEYSDFAVDSIAVKVTSDADALQADVKVGSISDSTIRITNLDFGGKAGHDSIDVFLKSTRNDGYTAMLLAGAFGCVPDGCRFRFNQDGVMFQNTAWSVSPDNFLFFGKNQFVAHDVVLRGGQQSLSFNSTNERDQRPPLRIDFANFDLATLARIVERDTGLLGGVITGNVVLQNTDNKMAFTSDLAIKDFIFGQRHVGDISLKADNQTGNVYAVSLGISGNGNQIGMEGKYESEAGGDKLDLMCDFTKVNLASVEPFTFGNVRRLSGTMTGGLHVTGTTTKPSVSGTLKFADVAFTPVFLDTYLRLANGDVELDGKGVELRSFNLVDTLGNKASLSGRLLTQDYRTFGYDFQFHTVKFLLLNKPASRDALYYGVVILDSDLSVKGDEKRPIITMQAELDKGTNLAIVLPESDLAVEERRGIVKFVDIHAVPNSILTRKDLGTDKDTAATKTSSMDLSSNLSINKDSKLRILIDPVAGDSLVIQGEATLSFTIDPSGKLTLTGRYDIVNGSYDLSFGDFVKREFAIEKGSSLTWYGLPSEADVDITAMYTVKASALELIQDQLAGISQEERNKYKQQLPIQVYLMMKGKLTRPEIHFKLDLPPDQQGALNGTVFAKLTELNTQESELNKQVFALLVLGSFISENPLASAGGNDGISDFARSSVSQLLSTQLNRLSQEYLAGANLNVGVDSYQDYSTGNAEGRTQLKLALSKQLFDERMTVQVGGDVDLEGRRSQENSLNNFAGDLKVLYKLSEDGRWQSQVTRQNTYEGAIDGDITKTGVGVVFTIDFDKLYGISLKPVPDKKVK